ncbi:MAG TPA: hypothetical protein VFJ30_08125, partial [Phycisphaerae bacterium]|nr:hypothetical protein [Phycisphaerae bacterium]
YYDGRRKSYAQFRQGMTLWAHTPTEPRASKDVIELDPIALLNVHGSGYCGIASGLLEGIYQSRPGGTPGKPAIDARRWFLGGIIHSVTDAYYDGRWHYLDIDLGGYAGDDERGVWSVADVLADPAGYYGDKAGQKSPYFFKADANGKWVEKINRAKSYAFQDNLMLGHEMTFAIRPGETFTRYFSSVAAGWSEQPLYCKSVQMGQKGFCEMVYAPTAPQAAGDALQAGDEEAVHAIRCPYTITSSRIEATGKVSVSYDLGRTWLPVDTSKPVALGRWDYLLKVAGGELKEVTTRGILHPGALPRVGAGATKMTLTGMGDYQTLTWTPDLSSPESLAKVATVDATLQHGTSATASFTGGRLTGRGSVTFAVPAPPGCKLVKVAACVLGGAGTTPSSGRYLELHIGPEGRTRLVGRSTDCSAWGAEGPAKVDHWQNTVNGSTTFAPADKAEVTVRVNGQGVITGVRIYAGYVPAETRRPRGTLTVTHGYDGKSHTEEISAEALRRGPATYTVPGPATVNEFVRMKVE